MNTNFTNTLDVEDTQHLRAHLLLRYEMWQDAQVSNFCQIPVKFQIKSTIDASTIQILQSKETEIGKDLRNIFEKSSGKLLVSGDAGAGKTFLLRSLALEYLRLNRNSMIPLLVNLSTWHKKYKNLRDWLIEVLPTELGTGQISSEQLEILLKKKKLIFLFDGLDELEQPLRSSCLAAIAKYRPNTIQYVVASQFDEYEAEKKGLRRIFKLKYCRWKKKKLSIS